jgi:hypothetical protein
MDNVATIAWSGDRYELTIGGILKAYTQDDHEAGRDILIGMVKEKGYEIELKGDQPNESIA